MCQAVNSVVTCNADSAKYHTPHGTVPLFLVPQTHRDAASLCFLRMVYFPGFSVSRSRVMKVQTAWLRSQAVSHGSSDSGAPMSPREFSLLVCILYATLHHKEKRKFILVLVDVAHACNPSTYEAEAGGLS